MRTWPTPALLDGLDAARSSMGDEVAALVGGRSPATSVETLLDCRYPGQSHELTVGSVEAFGAAHQRINGHVRAGSPVEVVAVRARASVPSPVRVLDLPTVTGRSPAVGPAVIAEEDCTIWLPPGWAATVGEAAALILRRTR